MCIASLGHSNRFAVPVGKASLILGKISKRNTAALRDSIETLPERAEYRLALDEMAIRSAGDYLQALVNFNNHHGKLDAGYEFFGRGLILIYRPGTLPRAPLRP